MNNLEDIEIKVLTERVNRWMETTTDYRISLCQRLDKIQDQLNNLPCDVRCEETKNIKQQILALWACTGGMMIAIISEWVKFK
jgi:hypothetical protein